MGKKYFIIANPSSVWTREIIKEIHVRNNDEVHLAVYNDSEFTNRKEYEDLGVKFVHIGNKPSLFDKINKFVKLLSFALKHRTKDRFDLIIIHCPPNSIQAYAIMNAIKIMKTKAFIVFWGSDILAIDSKGEKRLERLIREASGIAKMNEQMEKAFIGHYGHKYDNKFSEKQLIFGTLALPYINEYLSKTSKADCKRCLKIDANKLTIAVGYNGKAAQQHIKVLEQLEQLKVREKSKIFLIIHTYFGEDSTEYTDLLKRKLETVGIEYSIIERKLNFSEISVLRGATDILIHAQTSDALSGSIRESLLAEAILINPSWIHYYEYKELGVEYIEYDEFNELNDIVRKILDKEISINTVKNKNIIYKEYSWDKTRKDWIAAFEKCSD